MGRALSGLFQQMIALFTDFGLEGPYAGQMKAVLHRMAPGVPVIDLFADAPMGDPKASAYLLAAYAPWFPEGTVFLCVVDPGVGGERPAVVVEADGRAYVGPGNGLFELVRRRAQTRADRRDRLAAGNPLGELSRARPLCPGRRDDRPRRRIRPAVRSTRAGRCGPDWPDDLAAIVYVDHYGNAMTGLRASALPPGARLVAAGRALERARTFSDRPPGEAFWYENSNGLAEIAVNRGRADRDLGLAVGTPVEIAVG